MELQPFLSNTSYIYLSKDQPTFMLRGSGDPWPTFKALLPAAHVSQGCKEEAL